MATKSMKIGVAVSVGLIGIAAFGLINDEDKVTEERLTQEVFGDEIRSSCVMEALDDVGFDTEQLDRLLNGSEEGDELSDEDQLIVSDAFDTCNEAWISATQRGGESPGATTPIVPLYVVNSDGGAVTPEQVVEIQLFDDLVPIAPSNRDGR